MTRKDYMYFPMLWFEDNYSQKIAAIKEKYAPNPVPMPDTIIESKEGEEATESEKQADAAGYLPWHRYDLSGKFQNVACFRSENIAILYEAILALTYNCTDYSTRYTEYDPDTYITRKTWYLRSTPVKACNTNGEMDAFLKSKGIDLDCLITYAGCRTTALGVLYNLLTWPSHLADADGSGAYASFAKRPSIKNGSKNILRYDIVAPALLIGNMGLSENMVVTETCSEGTAADYLNFTSKSFIFNTILTSAGTTGSMQVGRWYGLNQVDRQSGPDDPGTRTQEFTHHYYRHRDFSGRATEAGEEDASQSCLSTALGSGIHYSAIASARQDMPGLLHDIDYYKKILGSCDTSESSGTEIEKKDMACIQHINAYIKKMLTSLKSIKGIHYEYLSCGSSGLGAVLYTKNLVEICGDEKKTIVDNTKRGSISFSNNGGSYSESRMYNFNDITGEWIFDEEQSYLYVTPKKDVTATGELYLFRPICPNFTGRILESDGQTIKIGSNPIRKPKYVIGAFKGTSHYQEGRYDEECVVYKPDQYHVYHYYQSFAENWQAYNNIEAYKYVKGDFLGYSLVEDVNATIYPSPIFKNLYAKSCFEVYSFKASEIVDWMNGVTYTADNPPKAEGKSSATGSPVGSHRLAYSEVSYRPFVLDFYFDLDIDI